MSTAWTLECQGCGVRAVAHVRLKSALCGCGKRMKIAETTSDQAKKWFKRSGKRGRN